MEPLIINVALSGNVHRKKDNPNVPQTIKEIVDDAERCYKAGATVVHLHAHLQHNGYAPTYRKDVYKELISRIRKRCDIIICSSTSGRVFQEFEHRSQVLTLKGKYKPDMGSLTMGSFNFPKAPNVNSPTIIMQLIAMMECRGIKPELEIFDTGMLNYLKFLMRKGVMNDEYPYCNFILGNLGSMPARPIDVEHLLSTIPDGAVWGATGVGRFQWEVNKMAIEMGGHVRVGLEDNIWFDENRTEPATNEMFVKRAVEYSEWNSRPIATVQQAREILRL